MLLSCLAADRPFHAAAAAFEAAFAEERFVALCRLLLLLEDSHVLRLPQRIAARYLLFSCWPPGQAENPFLSFLIKAIEDIKTADAEKDMCLQLLLQYDLDKLRLRTPSDYALTLEPGLAPSKQREDLLQHLHHLHDSPREPKTGPAVAPFPLTWQCPEPPLLRPRVDELHWLYPDLHSGLIWDCSMGEDARRVLVGGEAGGGAGDSEPDASSSAVVRELVQRAQKGPLLPAQQQQVLVALEAHPRLALSLLPGGSAQLPQLVEHCPAIAAELLIRLLQRREPPPAAAAVPASASVLPPLIDEMLATLARSEISLHGMEVVNRLASVDLPHDFVHAYIVNCLRSCEGTQDKYVQSRLVRLVCVFLHSLIRSRVVAAADLLHELQAFCISFSRIKEATGLFRLLKTIEGGGLPGASSPGGGGDRLQDEGEDFGGGLAGSDE